MRENITGIFEGLPPRHPLNASKLWSIIPVVEWVKQVVYD